MCAVIGGLVWGLYSPDRAVRANEIMNHIITMSHERGRDGRGFVANSGSIHDLDDKDTRRFNHMEWTPVEFFRRSAVANFLCNLRAEPTTEYVAQKRNVDQQPYTDGDWTIVHNGTIANDKDLRTYRIDTRIDSAAIAEDLGKYTSASTYNPAHHFLNSIKRLKGSYAILAANSAFPDKLFVAANYRPVWFAKTDVGIFFASARHYFPDDLVPQMLRPYTAVAYHWDGRELQAQTFNLRRGSTEPRRALVVCSGGLDSVVTATYMQTVLQTEVELIHFMYGSRAEGPEVKAVQAVAKSLGVPCTLFPLPIYKPGDSPLLQADSEIAGGEAGAEFAHEWVPARNLLLLSVATAYAEANGFDTIALGNNLEEAGAYPDNEPEFIDRFNDLLPFAVGDGKSVRVMMPVGNLMKHEIVKLGHEIGAPLHLTWSCYRAGEQHCGTCGPCYMRRTAFEINHIPEVISYKDTSK